MRNKVFWVSLLAVAIVFVAYGQTLRMYFWQDDSALIFKLQNPEGPAGSFGHGLWERGAYQYLVVPFVPFFKIFGLEPFGYFLIGLLSYIAAVGVLWFFARELFKDKRQAYFAALIFAAGYVGSEIMFRIINSWQTNIGLILALFSLTFYLRFTKNKLWLNYALSLVFFWASAEFVFIRSHSLIGVILAVEFLFLTLPFRLSKIPVSAARMLPFLFIFRARYLANSSFGGPGIVGLLAALTRGEIEVVTPLVANTANALVPDVIQMGVIGTVGTDELVLNLALFLFFIGISRITKVLGKASLGLYVAVFVLGLYFAELNLLWLRDSQSIFALMLGMYATVYTLLTKNKILILGLVLASSQIFGYYVQYPTSIFSTTHRYFSYSLIGFSVFYVALGRLVSKKLFYLLPVGIILLNLFLGFDYQKNIVEARSEPTRDFYKALTSYIPESNFGDIFYFDVVADSFYQNQFGNFFSVGSMPDSTALAIYYGVDRYDLSLATKFEEVARLLKDNPERVAQVHSFYFGPAGLINTSDKMQSLLTDGGDGTSPLTPIQLEFGFVGSFEEPPGNLLETGAPFDEKLAALSYIKARDGYYDRVKSSSVSEWQDRRIENLVDNDTNNPWQGHRIWWHDNESDEIMVDLGEIKNISRVIWQNWKNTLSPTDYEIFISVDGANWKGVIDVSGGGELGDGQRLEHSFEPADARFVKMVITGTLTNDSPAITDFEVVESRFADVNIQKALGFGENPFEKAGSRQEWRALSAAMRDIAFVDVSWETDKGDIYAAGERVKVIADGKNRSYGVIIPAGGTELERVDFNSSLPMNFIITERTAKNLTLAEILELNFYNVD